jgi:hypothetical protein
VCALSLPYDATGDGGRDDDKRGLWGGGAARDLATMGGDDLAGRAAQRPPSGSGGTRNLSKLGQTRLSYQILNKIINRKLYIVC